MSKAGYFLSCFGLTKKKYLDYYLFETKKQLGFFLRLVYGLFGVTTVWLVVRRAEWLGVPINLRTFAGKIEIENFNLNCRWYWEQNIHLVIPEALILYVLL